jgi:transcription initiation factor TFIID TATA-box-binding protein
MTKVVIVNVVATASLGQKLDLYELGKFKEIFHHSDVYGGRVAYFKMGKMKGKVSFFPSGKMISVGTRSEFQAFHELEQAMKFLVKKGFAKPVNLYPKTQNIVATVDFEKSLNLETLCEKSKAIYEPEQFSGAILRLEKPFKTSVLVFASGKVVITGLKSSAQIESTLQQLSLLVE